VISSKPAMPVGALEGVSFVNFKVLTVISAPSISLGIRVARRLSNKLLDDCAVSIAEILKHQSSHKTIGPYHPHAKVDMPLPKYGRKRTVKPYIQFLIESGPNS
jgi:hypothetical protein